MKEINKGVFRNQKRKKKVNKKKTKIEKIVGWWSGPILATHSWFR